MIPTLRFLFDLATSGLLVLGAWKAVELWEHGAQNYRPAGEW